MENESKDLTVIQPGDNGVEVYDPYGMSGLDDVAPLTPTNIILVQNVTRDPQDAHAGQFLDRVTGDVYDSITVVPLMVHRSRVMFPPGSQIDLDAEPVCRSSNGRFPHPQANQPQATRCDICPRAKWKADRSPSDCRESIRMLVLVKDAEVPRYFSVRGKSMPPTKNLLRKIREYIHRSAGRGVDLKLHDFYFTIESQKVTDRRGTYYVVKYADITKITNPGMFGPYFEQFVVNARFQETEVESEEATDMVVSEAIGSAPIQPV